MHVLGVHDARNFQDSNFALSLIQSGKEVLCQLLSNEKTEEEILNGVKEVRFSLRAGRLVQTK